jgi:ankyrin repeat protein
LAASVEDEAGDPRGLLHRDPSLGRSNLSVAAVLGDAEYIAERLRNDPAAALAVDHLRGWPPLLYLCYSKWHRIEPARTPGMLRGAGMLLDAGASPDTNNGRGPFRGYRGALHGSVLRQNPALARLLLDRGADPNHDRLSLVVAAGNGDHETLQVLLDHGAVFNWDWAVDTASEAGDAEAVRIFLDAASRWSPEHARNLATTKIGDAARRDATDVVATLLSFGADPNGTADQLPPLRLAVRAGAAEAPRLLMAAGAPDTATPVDHLLGACARGDRAAAEARLAEHPGLMGQLSDADQAPIVEFANRQDSAPVALMLDLGFAPDARNDGGETALHTAAYQGRATTVRLLLAHGADPEARDTRFEATPLAFATVGSGEHPNADGEWPDSVRALLAAGASTADVWVPDKPPSAEVAEVLRAAGVAPEPAVDDELPEPSGPLRELAEALRVAYDTVDLDRLATLLDPDVTWGGGPMGCHNRQDVLAWYRMLVERGVTGSLTKIVEPDDHTLIAEVTFSAATQGTIEPSPEVTYQRLAIRDGRICAITGHVSEHEAANFRPPPTGP